MTKRPLLVIGGLLLLAMVTSWLRFRIVSRTAGPLTHQPYVWQREWSPAVRDAVAGLDPNVAPPVLLAAEITWQGATPHVVRVPIDYGSLAGRPFGLALRIGAIDPTKVAPAVIADIAKSVIASAPTPPTELHIDFDCAESKLGGYRTWLIAIKEAAKPVPVAITALPAWLNNNRFRDLAREGPYILQVHSLQHPDSTRGDWRLIDAAAARAAVERAAGVAVPFRVALPTYGCVAVFEKETGTFIRLYSENYPGVDPAKFDVKWLRTDPAEMADLIRGWTANRPATLTGVMWYRLPVAGDQLNWRPQTLAAVIAGHTPAAKLTIVAEHKAGLAEVAFLNEGDADAPLPPKLTLDWVGRAPLASDFVNGYAKLDESATSVTLGRSDSALDDPATRLAPGGCRAIGWLRFQTDTEVRGHVTSSP